MEKDNFSKLNSDCFNERLYLIEKMFREQLSNYNTRSWASLDKVIISRDDEADNFEMMFVTVKFRFGSEDGKEQKTLELTIPSENFCNYDFIDGMIYQKLDDLYYGGDR